MVDGPKKEVELAQLHFEQRKSEWLLYRVFKHKKHAGHGGRSIRLFEASYAVEKLV